MPVWPPQNTGIFNLKIPGFGPNCGNYPQAGGNGPAFWLTPNDNPYFIDSSPPSLTKSSFTLPADVVFTPVCAQGDAGSLTYVSSQVIDPSGVLTSSITKTGPFSFSVTLTLPISTQMQIARCFLQVVYRDIDGNLGYGYYPIGSLLGNYSPGPGETDNYISIGTLPAMTGTGVAPATITTNTVTLTAPASPGAGWNTSIGFIEQDCVDAGIILSGTAAPTFTTSGPGGAMTLEFSLSTPYFRGKLFGLAALRGQYFIISGPTIVRNFYYSSFAAVEFDIQGLAFSK